MKTKQLNVRLSETAWNNLEAICQVSGANQTAVVEIALAALKTGLRGKDKIKMEYQNLTETLTQMRNFAEVCAQAYVNQYIDHEPVMDNPMIYYDRTNKKFGSCSSLTPLGDNEIAVETIEEGVYGDTGDDPEIARDAIIDYIMRTIDWRDMLNIIDPPEIGEEGWHYIK